MDVGTYFYDHKNVCLMMFVVPHYCVDYTLVYLTQVLPPDSMVT